MTGIAQQFGTKFTQTETRTTSYDYLRRFLDRTHDWTKGGAPDSDVLVPKLLAELADLDNKEFAFLLCHSGYIPEDYEHDSSEETIYTKLIEALVYSWAIRVGFDSTDLPKQKSSKEDITIQDAQKIIVCDAKSFRLGRSQKAPNVKDALKEGDIAKWLQAYEGGVRSSLGGLVTFPSQHDWSGGSDFYLYLTNKSLPIVCLYYEHLAYFLIAGLGKAELLKLYTDYAELFPVQLKKTDGNRAKYWSKVLTSLFKDQVAWGAFNAAAQDVIKEKIHHTIRSVEIHLSNIKRSIAQNIPEDLTKEQLREMLVEAKFAFSTFEVDRQLACITGFRSHSEDYLEISEKPLV